MPAKFGLRWVIGRGELTLDTGDANRNHFYYGTGKLRDL